MSQGHRGRKAENARAGDEFGPSAEIRVGPPDLAALLAALDATGVLYLVTGSVAALLHGVPLKPGDLDVTPALATGNSIVWPGPSIRSMRPQQD